jgi:hypothetical protein
MSVFYVIKRGLFKIQCFVIIDNSIVGERES